MSTSLFRRVRSLLGSDETDGQHTETTDSPTTALRTCPDCEKTFIVEEMDACPDCGTRVEETPTEEDLGFW